MKHKLTSLNDLFAVPFDDIIDVRAPSEFAEDHVPGALSLPVLSDAERAEVGTVYVQQDPFLARKLGAALVARNAAHHLQTALADRDGGWRPLVYCWRGGQRSGSFASILAQIGWRVGLIEGGYKSYRRLVVRAMYDDTLPFRIVLLDGGTGTAKTEILSHLAAQGEQVLDLEAMAQHRGSLLGGRPEGQPPQKSFESRIAVALAGLDPDRPVFIEAESNKIGARIIPPSLWKAMQNADHIRIRAPLDVRAKFLVHSYADLLQEGQTLDEKLLVLARFHGHDQVNDWRQMARGGAYEALARGLVQQHYDPSYNRSSRRLGAPLGLLDLSSLDTAALAGAANRIVQIVADATDK